MDKPTLDAAQLDALEQQHVPDGMFTRTDAYQTIAQARLALAQAERIATLEEQAEQYEVTHCHAVDRIATLEADCQRSYQISLDVMRERDEAQAHAAKLRDALEKLRSATDALMGDSDLDDDESPEMLAMQAAARVLAQTPAQSLAALKAEVLERAIVSIEAPEGECEGLIDGESNYGDAYTSGFNDGLRSARNSVRALAAQEAANG